MKKVTRSSLEKILSYLSLYQKQGLPDEPGGRILRDVDAYIRDICPDITTDNIDVDVDVQSETDQQILAVILIEKIKVCFKTLVNSSDSNIDKNTIQAFFTALS